MVGSILDGDNNDDGHKKNKIQFYSMENLNIEKITLFIEILK